MKSSLKKICSLIINTLAIAAPVSVSATSCSDYGALTPIDPKECCDGVAQYEQCVKAFEGADFCETEIINCCKKAPDYDQCAKAFKENNYTCPTQDQT